MKNIFVSICAASSEPSMALVFPFFRLSFSATSSPFNHAIIFSTFQNYLQ